MKPYEEFFDSRPGVCGGAPVIRGTRIRLKVVLGNLAEGHAPDDIVQEYPGLTPLNRYMQLLRMLLRPLPTK
jgi:uncharacterized protein (DUF433 family)